MYSLWAFYQKREGSSEKVTRKPRLPFYTVELFFSSFSLHTELEACDVSSLEIWQRDSWKGLLQLATRNIHLMWEVISKNAKHLALSNPMKMRWTCADPLWQKLFCGRVERRVLLVRVAALGREEGNFHKYSLIIDHEVWSPGPAVGQPCSACMGSSGRTPLSPASPSQISKVNTSQLPATG